MKINFHIMLWATAATVILTCIFYVAGYSYKSFNPFYLFDPQKTLHTAVDFKSYYSTAMMMKEGKSGIYNYNESYIYLRRFRLDNPPPGIITYPPSFYFLLTPLTSYRLINAVMIWLWSKFFAIFFVALFLILLVWKKDGNWKAKILATIVLSFVIYAFSPTLDDIIYGQVNIYILLMFLASLYLLDKKMELASGFLLGIIFCLKLISAPLILYLAIKGRWKTTLATIGAIFFVNLPVLLIFGPGIYYDYINSFGESLTHQIHFQNMSFLSRILSISNSRYFNIPLSFEEGMFFFQCFVLLIVFLTVIGYVKWRKENLLLDFSLLLTMSIIISPLIFTYHQVWLFIPLGFLASVAIYEKAENIKLSAFVIMIIIYAIFAILDGMSGGISDFKIRLLFIGSLLPLLLLIFLWLTLIFFKFYMKKTGQVSGWNNGMME